MKRRLFVVTGEASGDLHAAGLIRALRGRLPDLECIGTGGKALRAENVEILHDIHEMAAVGAIQITKLLYLRRVFLDLLAHIRSNPPDAVLLVDFPDFNLRLAKRIHAMGIRTIYYICPQVWAWRNGRIRFMEKHLDRLIAIFPFEPALFDHTTLRADFAGHPLAYEARMMTDEPEPDLPWLHGKPRIALLPGSRSQEIQRLLPVLLPAGLLIEKRYPGCAFICAASSEENATDIRRLIDASGAGVPQRLRVVTGQTRNILRQADAAIVASGTATLEAALMDCPTLVVYRTGWFTFTVGKRLVKIRHLGIVNIIANREIYPELLQNDCRPDRIAAELIDLISNPARRRGMHDFMHEFVAGLGDGNPYDHAAAIVAEELSGQTHQMSLPPPNC